MKPEITLLIPCHNAARFLPRLMPGATAQTPPFTRILCYDDGSSDETVAVARGLGLEILTPNPNRGVAHARNQLAAAATTEWIHFHDADDRISPDFVARLAPLCTDAADVVSCDADWIYEDTGARQLAWRYDPRLLQNEAAAHLLAHPLGLNNSIIRRSAWQLVGGCDESLAIWEDADVHFRMALAGARFRHVPEVLTWSLRRSESFSHDYRRNWRCRVQALQKYAETSEWADLRCAFAIEAEKAAANLVALGDLSGAQTALDLCAQLGHRAPSTRSALLRAARQLLPPLTVLRLQNWFRTRRRGTT